MPNPAERKRSRTYPEQARLGPAAGRGGSAAPALRSTEPLRVRTLACCWARSVSVSVAMFWTLCAVGGGAVRGRAGVRARVPARLRARVAGV